MTGEDYGWPTSSYGEPYDHEKKPEKKTGVYYYKKDHFSHGYVEPIFSYVPSIGISQIIKVPEYFSSYWKDDFLITSLNGLSIYRIKFDKNFSKIIYNEKIFIGERIRDIDFSTKENSFILALEDTGSIGILSNHSK